MTGTQVTIMWWVIQRADVSEPRGDLRSGGLAVSGKTQHPQPGWERNLKNLKLSGAQGARETGPVDQWPCLRQRDPCLIPSVAREPHRHCYAGLSLTLSPGRTEPGVKHLPSLQEAGVGKAGRQDGPQTTLNRGK